MGHAGLARADVRGKRVLVRVDINVPVENGQVADDTRIRRAVPTIRHLIAQGAKPILLAHFGRPGGRRKPQFSLEPLIAPLEVALGAPVHFCADCRGPAAEAAVAALPEGAALLLENTRFHPGETANDPELAAEMARLGDAYCNDAFSASHRAHASTEGLARLLPACAGFLVEAELAALDRALGNPVRPVMAVVGGSKVSTKIELLGNLVSKVDSLAIGGGMANTFLAANGVEIGASLAERDLAGTALEIAAAAGRAGCRILLPSDIVVARKLEAGAPCETLPVASCPRDAMILDAGPQTVSAIAAAMAEAATLIWNGPLGAFETTPFDAATRAAATEAARLTEAGSLVSVAGGGDTVAALNAAGVAEAFTHVSTAGGAFLEWMEGKTLPGIAALELPTDG